MKGLKKCFGVFLVLLTIFGLSLSVSLDVNALKHNFGSMPLYISQTKEGYQLTPNPFFIQFTPENAPDFNLSQTRSPLFFSPQVDNSSDICNFNPTFSNIDDKYNHMYFNNNKLEFSSPIVMHGLGSRSSHCRQLSKFGEDGMWDFNNSSASGEVSYFLNHFVLPYWYQYLKLTYTDSWQDPETGIIYDSVGLSASDFIGWDNTHKITSPNSFSIPIGAITDIKSDDFVNIVTGTNLHFYYELYLTDVASYDLTPSQNALFQLQYMGRFGNDNLNSDGGTVTCNKNISYDGYGVRLQFDCDWTADHDYGDQIGFNFLISPGQGYDKIWDVTFNISGSPRPDGQQIGGDISFFTKGLYVVTDYNDSPGGDLNSSSVGSDPGLSPGSAEFDFNNDDSSLEPSWFDSLLNLFSFGFFNPFAPIFNLFTDQNTCVDIPILSGMLHSEETRVCPWFDSNTRNIVTPVLGLASIMLVFGFAVRWLGSSSGNLFEDSSNEEVSNQGGRWGHFKRGG